MGDRRPYNVEDAIMIDPDTQNNNSPPTQPLSCVVIGEPAEGNNIRQSMIITHNYFEKVLVGDGPGREGKVFDMLARKEERIVAEDVGWQLEK